jgi:hypothetical protein
MRRPTLRVRWAAGLLLLLASLPPVLSLVLLPRFGTLQRNDYWGDFAAVLEGDRLTADPQRWLAARSNEHRITLPLLLWTANIHLFHGDNRGLSALSLLTLTGTLAILYRLLPESVRAGPLRRGLALAVLSWLVFTPAAAHNWVLGFSGNQWFLANLSAVAAIALFLRRGPEDRWTALLPALAVGALGVLCHSTALGLWPALFAGCLLVPRPRGALAVVAVGALAVGAAFASGYQVPAHHPAPRADVPSLATFVPTYLGSVWSHDVDAARTMGWVGLGLLALAVAAVLRTERSVRRPLVAWLAIAVYSLANACGSAVARSGFGERMAVAIRYVSLPALFWLGVLGVLGLALAAREPRGRRLAARWALAALAVSLAAASAVLGVERLRSQLHAVRYQPLAALALRWGVDDPNVLKRVTPAVREVHGPEAFFRRVGHVPYGGEDFCRLGERVAGAEPRNARSRPVGSILKLRPLRGGFTVVSGRLDLEPPSTGRVLFVDAAGRCVGGGVFVPRPRAPEAPLFPPPPTPRTWTGYLDRRLCQGSVAVFYEPARGAPWDAVALLSPSSPGPGR